MMSSPATTWSRAFWGALIARGVTDVFVSPGSRSQALALSALEWEHTGHLRVHVVIDEASAAFRALGIGLESAIPAVCIATSGSAPAHFMPAVMEAHHAGVPLVVVSADRPPEGLGVGANQTTAQSGLFGFASPTFDAVAEDEGAEKSALDVAAAAWNQAIVGAPAHVNVAFREPLSSSEAGDLRLRAVGEEPEKPHRGETLSLIAEPGTLVIAGHQAGERAEKLAYELGAPLIAEVTSGARFGPHLLVAYREVLAAKELPGPLSRIITVGRPTLSREVWGVVSDDSLSHIVLRGPEREPANPTHQAHLVDAIEVSQPATHQQRSEWVKPWVMASRQHHESALFAALPTPPDTGVGEADDPATRSAFAQQEMRVLRRTVTRAELALSLWEASWPHDRLVLGASRMIREMDKIVGPKNIPVFANRGLSGIDGTIATARGIALSAGGSGASGVTRVLLGDLAFLHDVGSLMSEPGTEDTSSVHLFIANDGGGTIFDGLEVSHSAAPESRDRVLYTPQNVDIEALAGAYGWDYRAVTTMGELADALVARDLKVIVDIALER